MKSILLKSIKKLHTLANPDASAFGRNWRMFPMNEYSSSLISEALLSPEPQMIVHLETH